MALVELSRVTEPADRGGEGPARVVDTRWDPPVTSGVRLMSVLADMLQHLGQVDYLRGLFLRAGRAG
jgi:hypothetical protein